MLERPLAYKKWATLLENTKDCHLPPAFDVSSSSPCAEGQRWH